VEPLSVKTLVAQTYDTILDAICDGSLKPGERLTQDELAKRLQVSRQPVTHALGVLKAQGFLTEAGRRGLAVAPLDRSLFEAIYQFRSAVEPLAVRLAVPRITAADFAVGHRLIAAGSAIAPSGDSRAMVRADMDFHAFIYEMSGNRMIVDTMRLNWQHLRRAMGEVLRHPDISSRVWREHAAILQLMERGDADAAAAKMRDHITLAYDDVDRTFDHAEVS
jgi:DNA-binding GntR family transcriptional regulator